MAGASSPRPDAAAAANSRSVASSGATYGGQVEQHLAVGLAVATAVQLGRLPRLQAQCGYLFGKHLRIGRVLEGLVQRLGDQAVGAAGVGRRR